MSSNSFYLWNFAPLPWILPPCSQSVMDPSLYLCILTFLLLLLACIQHFDVKNGPRTLKSLSDCVHLHFSLRGFYLMQIFLWMLNLVCCYFLRVFLDFFGFLFALKFQKHMVLIWKLFNPVIAFLYLYYSSTRHPISIFLSASHSDSCFQSLNKNTPFSNQVHLCEYPQDSQSSVPSVSQLMAKVFWEDD